LQFIDQCKAQFEDDNQYAIHVAPEPEETTDRATMMHSLAGLVAQSVSAAFFRPPVRSSSITARDDGREETMAVASSGHSTYSPHSGNSKLSDADRTMSALEAIRAEDRKKRLAEMNAEKAASPAPSAINLRRSVSGSKGGGIRFSEEGDALQAGPSASKMSAKGLFRAGGSVKFNEGELDLEKGQISGSKPPSRIQSARIKGGLKKVSVIEDDEGLPPLPPGQSSRKLFSFASDN
jgi:hypothetical protein